MRRLLVISGGLLLACAGLDGPTEGTADAPIGTRAGLEGLEGIRIWVQVRDPATRQKWCDAFAAGGMIVECEETPQVDMYEVFLKCPTIPDGAGQQIARFVGQPGMDVWDWRDDADFGPNYCGQMDAISLELLE